MWNKEHKIYGYHLYAEGKPIVEEGKFDPVRKATILTVAVPAKEGGLIESVGLVQLGGFFLRARVKVHQKDDFGRGTKKKGRMIAVNRLIVALNSIASKESGNFNAIIDAGKLPRSVDVVSFAELTDREKALFEKHDEAGK